MEMLCKIRDLQRSIAEFEYSFENKYGICLNEGMLLCSLLNSYQLNSGQIAELLGLSSSNTSKVIKQVEDKGFVKRTIGEADKRQMYFYLTKSGEKKLQEVKSGNIEIPDLLKQAIT